MGVTHFIAENATALIDKVGYLGVFVLMVMESMVFPVPSEAVMPFAGFLIAEGRFGLPLVIIVSTAASIVGSLISYYIGRWGGEPFVVKWGRFFLLNRGDLDKTTAFFAKYGDATILVSRFIPVVRHLISIPAGVAKMNLVRFSIYTIVGAGMWNTFLTVVGMYLRSNWETVMKYSHVVDIVVVVILAAGFVYFVVKHLHLPKTEKA
jgi:membrane protein DedA with SNARE-associated domain